MCKAKAMNEFIRYIMSIVLFVYKSINLKIIIITHSVDHIYMKIFGYNLTKNIQV